LREQDVGEQACAVGGEQRIQQHGQGDTDDDPDAREFVGVELGFGEVREDASDDPNGVFAGGGPAVDGGLGRRVRLVVLG
jgi:hypothetical protein